MISGSLERISFSTSISRANNIRRLYHSPVAPTAVFFAAGVSDANVGAERLYHVFTLAILKLE